MFIPYSIKLFLHSNYGRTGIEIRKVTSFPFKNYCKYIIYFYFILFWLKYGWIYMNYAYFKNMSHIFILPEISFSRFQWLKCITCRTNKNHLYEGKKEREALITDQKLCTFSRCIILCT